MKKFRIRIVSDYILSINEIWPDGDAPKNPTVRDVEERVKTSEHSLTRVAEEWNLTPELFVNEIKNQ